MRFRPCGRLVSLPVFSLAPKRAHHERRLRQRVCRGHDDQHDDLATEDQSHEVSVE